MRLTHWIRGMFYRGHDRHGDAKYLLGRAGDPSLCEVHGISASIRDEALDLLCDSFDIPKRQMYCLRPADNLMAIYRSMNGPRSWDEFQFERLSMAIEEMPGPELSEAQMLAIKTVEDVICVVAARRAVT